MSFAPPFPFFSTIAALAWYRAYFGGVTGNRQVTTSTSTTPITMKPGQTLSRRLSRNEITAAATARLIDDTIDCTTNGTQRRCIQGNPAADFIAENLLLTGSSDEQINLGGTAGHPATVTGIRGREAGADFAKPQSFTNWANVWFSRGGITPYSHADMFQPTPSSGTINFDGIFSDMATDEWGTHSNSAFFFSQRVHDVKIRNAVLLGGNYAIHADCIRLDVDEIYYFTGSARYGLSTAWRSDARIGPNIFDAVTGQHISIHAK